MPVVKRLLREPVVHFIAAGILLYAAAAVIRGPDLMPADDRQVLVDRDALLEFMQFRANVFDAETFEQAFRNLGDAEKDSLIEQYITEEILYREAWALGLGQSDYIIRQRMVEKMRFLLGDLAGAETPPTDEELQRHFEDNRTDYFIEPSMTFTHVFFDANVHGDERAMALTREAVDRLNADGIGFHDAGGIGDRYAFLRNYVERTVEYVRGHFGADFADALTGLEPSDTRWHGPLRSEYGYHAVMVTGYSPARVSALDDVRHDVELDFIRQRRQRLLDDMVQAVREQYRVQVELD